MVERYDTITVKAEVTPEGWIRDNPIITRSGIFIYKNGNKTVREYRPETEVFKEDSLATLLGAPITDGHNGILTAQSKLDSMVGTVLSSGARSDTNVVADIVIHNVNKLGKKRELSLGYTCEVDDTPGQLPDGTRYDAIQKNIKYNHLAVVHHGRAGNARIRLDSTSYASFDVEDTMTEVTLPKVRLDNIEYPAAPEVINKLSKLESDLSDLKTRLDKAEGERDAVKSELAASDKKHKDSLEAERVLARQRINIENVAKKLEVKMDDDTTDRQGKEAIIKKLGHELKFDGKSDDYVNSAYDMAVAKMDNTAVANQKRQVTKQDDKGKTSGSYSSKDARERMLARLRGEKSSDGQEAA